MKDICNLDDFSSDENNLNESEEKSINYSNNTSNIINSPNIDLLLTKNFSAENPKIYYLKLIVQTKLLIIL